MIFALPAKEGEQDLIKGHLPSTQTRFIAEKKVLLVETMKANCIWPLLWSIILEYT